MGTFSDAKSLAVCMSWTLWNLYGVPGTTFPWLVLQLLFGLWYPTYSLVTTLLDGTFLLSACKLIASKGTHGNKGCPTDGLVALCIRDSMSGLLMRDIFCSNTIRKKKLFGFVYKW